MADLTGLGSVADFAKGIVDRFFPPSASPEEKLRAQTDLQRMVEERENVVVNAKAAVMTAELAQEDKLTKRARPAIIYVGLAVIVANNSFFPMITWLLDAFTKAQLPPLPALTMPTEFWLAWGGVCSIYVLGRTREKTNGIESGAMGKFMELIAPKK